MTRIPAAAATPSWPRRGRTGSPETTAMIARPLVTAALALLLTLPLAIPAAAEAETGNAGYTVSDGTGDQATLLGLGPAAPANPAMAHADLVELRIEGEDDLGFYIIYKMAALDYANTNLLCCSEQVSIFTMFQYGNSAVPYHLDVRVSGEFADADTNSPFVAGFIDSSLCLMTEDDECYRQPAYAYIEDEANEVRVWIPKESLLGQLQYYGFENFGDTVVRPAATPSVFHAGDKITGLTVEVTYIPAILLLPAAVVDTVPDAGAAPDFTFARPLANQVIALSMDRSYRLAVETGANQSIPFTLENRAAGKRLVAMQYELQGPAEAVSAYRVDGPATVSIPGGQSRNFSLALNVKPTATPEDGVYLILRGTSVNDPNEVAFTSRMIVPGGVLGPGSNVLFMHTQRFGPGPPLDAALCTLPFTFCDYGFLSAIKSHPAAQPGRVRGFGYSYTPDGGEETVYVGSELELASAIAFDVNQPIQVDLNLASGQPGGAVEVDVIIQYWAPEDSGTLFEGSGSGATGAGSPVTTITGPVRLGAAEGERAVLPAGTWLELIVEITYPPSSTATVDWVQGGSGIHSEGTQIILPLIEVPEDLRTGAVDSPIQIGATEDSEDFVNPGEARLFNVSVLNQAEGVLRVALAAEVDQPGWSVEIVPGRVFELAEGDTILLGVLVRASPNASEGDVAIIKLNATAEGFPNAATLTLRAVVTNFDLPDDSGMFAVSDEDAAKIVAHEAEDTPGPGPLLLVPALVGAGWVLRRRRAPGVP